MFKFFQCWFLKRHPWNRNGTLKFVSPCAYMTAAHIWFHGRFRGLFKKKMEDSRVQKAIVWLVVLKKQKRLSQLRNETRSSLAPLLRALKRRQYGLLQALLSCLNPPRSRKVWIHPHSFAWFDVVDVNPDLTLFDAEKWDLGKFDTTSFFIGCCEKGCHDNTLTVIGSF